MLLKYFQVSFHLLNLSELYIYVLLLGGEKVLTDFQELSIIALLPLCRYLW